MPEKKRFWVCVPDKAPIGPFSKAMAEKIAALNLQARIIEAETMQEATDKFIALRNRQR